MFYQKTNEPKIIRTYVVNKSIYEQFKIVAEKDMRKFTGDSERSESPV